MTERILAGVTRDTFKHLQLGAGAIIRDFEYENITTPAAFKEAFLNAIRAGQSLGGTQGGIDIEITPTYRKIPIDGANVPFKGDKMIDEWLCQMSATLKEFTPDIIRAAFPTGEFTEAGENIASMRIRTAVSEDDYAKNHCWIATTQYGYIMIAMFNTLSGTTGAISAADKSEGNIPVRITGHIEDFEDIDFAPCEIWFVDTRGGVIDMAKVGNGGL